MKKKFWAVVLCMSLTATLFVGCGSSNDVASNNANTESNVTESKTENSETEVVETEATIINYREDVETYLGIYINNKYFNLLDNTVTELEAMLLEQDWTTQTVNYIDFIKADEIIKHREKNGAKVLQLVRPTAVKLNGGISQDSTREEVTSIWGEPDYIYTYPDGGRDNCYYVHSSGLYWISLYFESSSREETSMQYKIKNISLCYCPTEYISSFEMKLIPDSANELRNPVSAFELVGGM